MGERSKECVYISTRGVNDIETETLMWGCQCDEDIELDFYDRIVVARIHFCTGYFRRMNEIWQQSTIVYTFFVRQIYCTKLYAMYSFSSSFLFLVFFFHSIFKTQHFSNKTLYTCYFFLKTLNIHKHDRTSINFNAVPITTINSFRKLIVSFCIFFVPFLSLSVYFYRVTMSNSLKTDCIVHGLDVAWFQMFRDIYIKLNRQMDICICLYIIYFFFVKRRVFVAHDCYRFDALYRFHFGSVIVHSLHFLSNHKRTLVDQSAVCCVFQCRAVSEPNDKI